MPRHIVKFETAAGPRFLEWSTIVDAPVTWGMTREQFEAYYRDRYGSDGMRELPERFARIAECGPGHGSSEYDPGDLDGLIACNRAGAREEEMTLDQIIQYYCPPTLDHLPKNKRQLCWRPEVKAIFENLAPRERKAPK